MIDEGLLRQFLDQLDGLKRVVSESSSRSIANPPDMLFYDNQNIFIKSYLVSACSILEAFVQDLAGAYVDELQIKINAANLPFNLVAWVADYDKAKLEFKPFEARKSRKDIADLVSPSYWKTLKAFERVGIDLSQSDVAQYKDMITARVEKRNKIVHHNDDALDLSFSDVSDTIDQFKHYLQCLFDAVRANPHRGSVNP